MNIAIPKELHPQETRVPLMPSSVEKLLKKGASIQVESRLGASCHIDDAQYVKAGATIISDRQQLLSQADIVLRLRKPPLEEIQLLKSGSVHISFLDPFFSPDLLQALAKQGVSALCMELIPRSTRAQKMDALSSQASLAGYVAVILASHSLRKILPMMTTPSGTIPPAKVFVIGAGVAGLQAIATARRLGARVEAFDTRPAVEEQVKSLGARFVKIDLGKTEETKDGYAKALTEDQLQKQREGLKKICATSDIVISTAQTFGRKAPIIITRDMLMAMPQGSVAVDLAVDSGGNIEGMVPGETIQVGGVQVMGLSNLPGRVAYDASQMYSNNLVYLLEEFWNKESKQFELKQDDDIIKGCLVTHQGAIVHPQCVI